MTDKPVSGQFEDVAFTGRRVELDGSSLVRCRLEKCQLVYSGGPLPVISGCQFNDCTWSFAGEAANTIGFLSGLYQGGFRELVEATMQQIRDGALIERQTGGDGSGGEKWHGAKPLFGQSGPTVYKLPKPKQP